MTIATSTTLNKAPKLTLIVVSVITSRVKGHEHCSSQELMNCAKPLSVLTDSGLTFVSSKADLDKICP